MSSKTIFSSTTVVANFVDQLESVTKEFVDANIPSGKKVVGRTAEALGRLRTAAQEEGFESGYIQGFEQGEIDAKSAVEERYTSSLNDFAAILQEKSDLVFFAAKSWAEESEHLLAELGVLIAARILEQEILLPHDTITEIAKEAIQEVLLAETIRLRVNPFDVPVIQERKNDLLAVNKQLRNIEIVDDPAIVGGCIVESDAGLVDATIKTKVDLLIDSIRQAA